MISETTLGVVLATDTQYTTITDRQQMGILWLQYVYYATTVH